jgi:transposase
VDVNTGLIVASILTEHEVDPSQVGPLLDQIEQEIGQVTADGAYDGEPTLTRPLRAVIHKFKSSYRHA